MKRISETEIGSARLNWMLISWGCWSWSCWMSTIRFGLAVTAPDFFLVKAFRLVSLALGIYIPVYQTIFTKLVDQYKYEAQLSQWNALAVRHPDHVIRVYARQFCHDVDRLMLFLTIYCTSD